MTDMLFDLPKQTNSIIKVVGVGGGGGNAVAHMYTQGIKGVNFAICNTDNQALDASPVDIQIQLGPSLTEGRGAGSKPEVGKQACIESIEDVRKFLSDGTKMLFITAGMGGGTGTGAAPIIAKVAKEMDILTVAIVTLPFKFEGLRRKRQALEGLENLKKCVDSILVISNDKMKEIHGSLPLSGAFNQADNILTTAAKGIAEIITMPGYINVDFEDVNTVMKDSGVAIMGSAWEEGDDRARKAINGAMNSPLLEDNDIRGAQHILLNITSGSKEVTMDEISEITDYVQEEVGHGTDMIWGNCYDESLGDKIMITLIATGFKEGAQKVHDAGVDVRKKVSLDDRFEEGNIDGVSTGLSSGEETFSIDFDTDDVKRTVETLGVSGRIKSEEPIDPDYLARQREERRKIMEMEAARRDYLRQKSSIPLDSPKVVMDLENEPAYKRRKVELDDISKKAHANRLSTTTLGLDDDGNPTMTDNSYLYDNVD